MRNAAVMLLWFALIAGTVFAAHLVVDRPYRELNAMHTDALEFQLTQQEQTIQALRDSIEAVRARCAARYNLLRCLP